MPARKRPASPPDLVQMRAPIDAIDRQTPPPITEPASFARYGLRMNRIESRPSHQAKWGYAIFIDLARHAEEPAMQRVLDALRRHAARTKVLGAYPVAVP